MPDVVFLPIVPLVRALWAVNCTIAVLMLIVVGLRIFSRIHFKAGIGYDDAWILVSIVPALGMLIISGYFGALFTGHSIKEVPIQNSLLVSRLLIPYELLYVLTVGTTKLSILCFYLRVFVQPYIRWSAKVGIVVVSLGELGMILQPFLMCRPWQAIYDKTITGAPCGDQHASLISMGVWAMVTDIIVLALPVPALWELHMGSKKKMALIVVFTIGLLATAVATARVYFLAAVYLPTADAAYTATWPDFLAVLEPNLNILCTSLPMLSWIFKRALAKTTVSGSSRKAYYAANPADGHPRGGGSGVATFGGSAGDRFHRIQEDVDDGAKGGGSVVLETLRTRTETECRADSRSDTGSETALSPVGKGDRDYNATAAAKRYSGGGSKGITVSRSIIQASTASPDR